MERGENAVIVRTGRRRAYSTLETAAEDGRGLEGRGNKLIKLADNIRPLGSDCPNNTPKLAATIDCLPCELLCRVLLELNFKDRLRAELVSSHWRTLLLSEGWRKFTQCRITTHISSNKIFSLFRRCGAHLRELLIVPVTLSEGHWERRSAGPVFDWVQLLRRLTALCVMRRELTGRHWDKLTRLVNAGQLTALHFDDCFNKLAKGSSTFNFFNGFLAGCHSLRYLALSKMPPLQAINHPCSFPPSLMWLDLDDSCPLAVMMPRAQQCCPRLQTLILAFKRPISPSANGLGGHLDFLSEELLGRLHHFEVDFVKQPSKELVEELGRKIKWLTSIRVLCVKHVNGKLLTEVARLCPLLEYFEYHSIEADLLPAFPCISRLKQLRVFAATHYKGAQFKEMPTGVLDALTQLASNRKLEYFMVNFKLPPELTLLIVRENPTLSYLACTNPSSKLLTELVSTVRDLHDNFNSNQSNIGNFPHRPLLRFRVPFSQWKKRRENGTERAHPALIFCHQPPLEEASTVVAHLRAIFNGSVPEFLLHCHPTHYDDELEISC